MRTPIPFDTLEYHNELTKSGMEKQHADSITKATSAAFKQILENNELATKTDVRALEVNLTKYISDSVWKTIGYLATFQTIIIGLYGLSHYLTLAS